MLTGSAVPRLLAAACMLVSQFAFAEDLVSVYTGTSFTRNSDLHLRQGASGTDLVLHDIHWDAKPFSDAPYYGVRLTRFFDRNPQWGVALDFTHYKMIAETGRTVAASGTWKGAPAGATVRMNQYVQQFEISHGVNILSLNGMRRWVGLSGWQPYAGLGLVYYRPHAESTVDQRSHATGYQSSGFGYQMLGGMQYPLAARWLVFAEAKFNRGRARVEIDDGHARTPLRTFHLVGGVHYSF